MVELSLVLRYEDPRKQNDKGNMHHLITLLHCKSCNAATGTLTIVVHNCQKIIFLGLELVSGRKSQNVGSFLPRYFISSTSWHQMLPAEL